MTLRYRLSSALLLALPFVSSTAFAADCEANLTSSGSILTGRVYKTFAELPNAAPDGAFQGAYQAVVTEGWRIDRVDKEGRVLSANNINAGAGRSMPLNVIVEPAGSGARITLTYGTPAGAFTPENTIKGGFCRIVQAASGGQAAGATAQAGGNTEAMPGTSPAPAAAGADRAPLCLANACLGMTLDQAAALPLISRGQNPGPATTPNPNRNGQYGIDTKGKVVTIFAAGGIDRAWIADFRKNVRMVCTGPLHLSAGILATDGQRVDLGFDAVMREGKVDYVLNDIKRMLPNPMSPSERKNLEDQMRARYGAALQSAVQESAALLRNQGVVKEPAAVLSQYHLRLKGATLPRIVGANLMEQPGCSVKSMSLD